MAGFLRRIGRDRARPEFHGDTLHVQSAIIAVRASMSRHKARAVGFEHRGCHQRVEVVCVCRRSGFMKRLLAQG
jgi:acyl dehydratase